MVHFSKSLIALAASASLVLAHPGHDARAEALERREAMGKMKYRSLDHCADKLKERGVEAASIARRKAAVNNLREKRSLKARDFETVLNTDHKSNQSYNEHTPADVMFNGLNTCILTPDTTEGPYYVSGEYVRRDVTDGEEGVPLTYEVQIIDVNTCEPMPRVFLEQWHCNSTGVYGGIAASFGNGNINDTANIQNTMLRGIQYSDPDGVVTFDTIFPGHYAGRATHIHVLAHHNATLLPNRTISGGTVSHVGQIFFDQSLISLAEEEAPYNTNTQALLTNAEDDIMRDESQDVDPVLHYTLIGNDVSQGVFGWMAFGLDAKANVSVHPAAFWTENGGVKNPEEFVPPPINTTSA